MKLPRPPGWETRPAVVRARQWWHRHGLPCPYCLLEGRYGRRAQVITLLVILAIVVLVLIILGVR